MPSIDNEIMDGAVFLNSLRLPAAMSSLRPLVRFAVDAAVSGGLPHQRLGEMELAVEELIANIVMYAYPDANGDVEVNCFSVEAGRGLLIELIDSGVPFDILSAARPDLNSSVKDRSVGGFGIFLARQFADALKYHRSEGQNIVHLVFSTKND